MSYGTSTGCTINNITATDATSCSDFRNRCCFQRFHIETGTQLMLCIFIILSFIPAIIFFPLSLLWIVPMSCVTVCTIMAFVRKSATLIIPHLVLTAMTIIAYSLAIIIVFLSALAIQLKFVNTNSAIIVHSTNLTFTFDSMETAIEESPLKVSLIEILLAIIAIFHVWQFAVFYRCREYYLMRTRSPKPNVAYQSDGTSTNIKHPQPTSIDVPYDPFDDDDDDDEENSEGGTGDDPRYERIDGLMNTKTINAERQQHVVGMARKTIN